MKKEKRYANKMISDKDSLKKSYQFIKKKCKLYTKLLELLLACHQLPLPLSLPAQNRSPVFCLSQYLYRSTSQLFESLQHHRCQLQNLHRSNPMYQLHEQWQQVKKQRQQYQKAQQIMQKCQISFQQKFKRMQNKVEQYVYMDAAIWYNYNQRNGIYLKLFAQWERLKLEENYLEKQIKNLELSKNLFGKVFLNYRDMISNFLYNQAQNLYLTCCKIGNLQKSYYLNQLQTLQTNIASNHSIHVQFTKLKQYEIMLVDFKNKGKMISEQKKTQIQQCLQQNIKVMVKKRQKQAKCIQQGIQGMKKWIKWWKLMYDMVALKISKFKVQQKKQKKFFPVQISKVINNLCQIIQLGKLRKKKLAQQQNYIIRVQPNLNRIYQLNLKNQRHLELSKTFLMKAVNQRNPEQIFDKLQNIVTQLQKIEECIFELLALRCNNQQIQDISIEILGQIQRVLQQIKHWSQKFNFPKIQSLQQSQISFFSSNSIQKQHIFLQNYKTQLFAQIKKDLSYLFDAIQGNQIKLPDIEQLANKIESLKQPVKENVNKEQAKIQYNCALGGKLLLQGKLFICKQHLFFFSSFNKKNLFVDDTNIIISRKEIIQVQKRTSALFFNNSIAISTNRGEIILTSFFSRDSAYDDIKKFIQEEEQMNCEVIVKETQYTAQQNQLILKRQLALKPYPKKRPQQQLIFQYTFKGIPLQYYFQKVYSDQLVIYIYKYDEENHFYGNTLLSLCSRNLKSDKFTPQIKSFKDAITGNHYEAFLRNISYQNKLPKSFIPLPDYVNCEQKHFAYLISRTQMIFVTQTRMSGVPYSNDFYCRLQNYFQQKQVKDVKQLHFASYGQVIFINKPWAVIANQLVSQSIQQMKKNMGNMFKKMKARVLAKKENQQQEVKMEEVEIPINVQQQLKKALQQLKKNKQHIRSLHYRYLLVSFVLLLIVYFH